MGEHIEGVGDARDATVALRSLATSRLMSSTPSTSRQVQTRTRLALALSPSTSP